MEDIILYSVIAIMGFFCLICFIAHLYFNVKDKDGERINKVEDLYDYDEDGIPIFRKKGTD